MALFNQSVKAISAVVQEIADSAGVSADAEMQVRAGRSLNAAIEHFNTRANWDYLLFEAPPTSIIGPFSVTGVTASPGASSALAPVGHGLLVDDLIFANGIRVTATAAGNFGFSSVFGPAQATSLDLTVTRDRYSLPTDFKMGYDIRMYGSLSALRPIRRRQYDRSIGSDFTPGTPVGYDIFPIAAKGKIQLLPPPGNPDAMCVRYYRRMTTITATADTAALDIPQDYEPYLVAWSKWHFLLDKGEGRMEQGSTWFTFAENGIKAILADQARVPDEDLGLIPGMYSINPSLGPNSVRGALDNC
jgi:hypothetical protein